MQERYKPMYEAPTALESLNKAIELVTTSTQQEQIELLKSSEFTVCLGSALNNMDEYTKTMVKRVIDSFDPSLQPDVENMLSDF